MTVLLYLEVFFFIFAILCIIRDFYGLAKVIRLKEGKLDMGSLRIAMLGISISYVITMLILGF